jgi:iron(III) transport system permease protein
LRLFVSRIAIEAQNYFAPASAICIKCRMSVTQKDHLRRVLPQEKPSWDIASIAWPLATALVALVVAAPILAVLWSLTQASGDAWAHLGATVLPGYVGNTLLLMALVGVMTILLGVGSAWLIVSFEFPGQRILSWALVLPLAMPGYIIAYVYTDLLEFAGPVQTLLRDLTGWQAGDYVFPPIRSLWGASLMLSLVLYPYVYLLTRTSFQRQSVALVEATRVLGVSPAQAFLRVALPCARPAIAGGVALALMETIADYGVADYFGVSTLTAGIFRTWLGMGEPVAAAQIAAVLFLFAGALVLLERLNRQGTVANPLGRDVAAARISLTPLKSAGAILACALPVTFGFVIPAIVLVRYAFTVGDPLLGTRFISFAANSLSVAAGAALIGTGIALFLAYAERRDPTNTNRLLVRLATLGYALPGAMIAVGILAIAGALDTRIAIFMRDVLGMEPKLLLTGTVAGLLFAYVTRFLTAAFNSTQAGLEKIHGTLDDAARMLGAGPGRVLRAVHLPLLRGPLLAGFLLVFIDVMKELPATLLLRPFNFETLATRTYRLASDERLAEASTSALLIVALGLIPTIMLSVSIARSTFRR